MFTACLYFRLFLITVRNDATRIITNRENAVSPMVSISEAEIFIWIWFYVSFLEVLGEYGRPYTFANRLLRLWIPKISRNYNGGKGLTDLCLLRCLLQSIPTALLAWSLCHFQWVQKLLWPLTSSFRRGKHHMPRGLKIAEPQPLNKSAKGENMQPGSAPLPTGVHGQ